MSAPAPAYDLTLVLDPQAEDEARAKIVADARAAIEGQGELLRHDGWGERPLSYPINRRTSGDYHLLQFHSSSPELLATLDHSLRISDGILRFRIIKQRAGAAASPPAAPVRAPVAASEPQPEPVAANEPQPEPVAASEPAPEPAATSEPPATLVSEPAGAETPPAE